MSDSYSVSPGVRSMALSALGFSCMALFVKVAGRTIPSQEIVLARALIGLVLSWAFLRQARVAVWGRRRGLLVLRGLLGTGGLCCYFYAVVHLPLAEATVIQYLNPVLTALLAAAVLGERLRPVVLASAALSLTGVALVAKPAFLFGAASSLDPLAVGVALGGATFSALAYIVVRRLSQTEHTLVIIFYFPLVAVPLIAPTVVPVAVMPRGWEWGVLLAVGVFTQVGQIFLTRGLRLEPAGRATALSYLQVLFASVFGALFFDEVPDGWTVAGALLILFGTLLVGLQRSRGGTVSAAAPR